MTVKEVLRNDVVVRAQYDAIYDLLAPAVGKPWEPSRAEEEKKEEGEALMKHQAHQEPGENEELEE